MTDPDSAAFSLNMQREARERELGHDLDTDSDTIAEASSSEDSALEESSDEENIEIHPVATREHCGEPDETVHMQRNASVTQLLFELYPRMAPPAVPANEATEATTSVDHGGGVTQGNGYS